MPEGWEWDETLYRGSARFYAQGRLPYAARLPDALAQALGLDGRGRLIDVGCGPGILSLMLAHLFEETVGVDPDPDMLAEGARRAREAGIGTVRWLRSRAEDLPSDLGPFRVATFGQSFHWMDRPRVAAIMLDMLEPNGALVHVSDAKDRPEGDLAGLSHPGPPFDAIRELVHRYVGPVRRAGRGVLPHGTPGGEAAILRRAGFAGPTHLRVLAGDALERTTDDLVAWVYSMSSSAPHLFGDRLSGFEAELREMLQDVSPTGIFSEWVPDTEVFIWHVPRP